MWNIRKCVDKDNNYSGNDVMKRARDTRAFEHISDDVIKGWLMGRLEMHEHGQHRTTKYTPAFYEDIKCGRCKGRGWFGRGRPKCDECDGVGRIAKFNEGEWTETIRLSGISKRRLLYLKERHFNDRSSYLRRFKSAINSQSRLVPSWFFDLRIEGNYSNGDKKKIMNEIAIQFGNVQRRPLIDVDCEQEDFQWSGDSYQKDKRGVPGFNLDECLGRLALTFGCTCPVTGQVVPPCSVSSSLPSRDLTHYIEPLGFSVIVGELYNGGHRVRVSPLSDAGVKAVIKAIQKWNRENAGDCVPEWVMAEVMKTHVLKRVA